MKTIGMMVTVVVLVAVSGCHYESGVGSSTPPDHSRWWNDYERPDMTLVRADGDPTYPDLSLPADMTMVASVDLSTPADMTTASAPDFACVPAPFTPTVELLIDRSGSMTTKDSGNTLSRWQLVKYALTDPTMGVLTGLQSDALFGAALFSGGSEHSGTCLSLVPSPTGLAPALDNASAIAGVLTSNSPSGSTPTAAAITATATYVEGLSSVAGPRYIILATDGLPNTCGSQADDTANTVLAIQAAYTAGIVVYVLGVGPDTSDANLQAMANAGQGVSSGAVYYKGTMPIDLVNALHMIINDARGCNL